MARNVSEAADPPRRSTPEFQPLSPNEVKRFLEAVKEARPEAIYVLAVTTGMRRGELLGLHWRDADLDQGTLQVRYSLQQEEFLGEPNTARARRHIDLPPLAVEALQCHRIFQLKDRFEASPVFTNGLGNYVDPDNL